MKSSFRLARSLGVVAAVLLVVQSVWMIGSADTVEGRILIVFDHGHGLTISDLCGVALALLALGLWFFVVFGLPPVARAARRMEERIPVAIPESAYRVDRPHSPDRAERPERADRRRASDAVSVR